MCIFCGSSEFKNKWLSFVNDKGLSVIFESFLVKRHLELGGGFAPVVLGVLMLSESILEILTV